MASKRITLAYSSHRPEILPFAADSMQRHQAVILEEPPFPGFDAMLAGRLPIKDYLLATDYEFPAFAAKSCQLLRTLFQQGKTILQVEPFMEILGGIHEFFADGGRPREIEKGSLRSEVYEAERHWTAALLDFYEKSMHACFAEVVEAVKAFAKADAARGRVKDRLRAEALAQIIPAHDSIYIETGYIHFALLPELAHRLPKGTVLTPVHLLEPVVRKLAGKRQVFGPGDILTLFYTFRPHYEGKKADLLAARSLIYIKIVHKGEITKGGGHFPHTRDEIESSRLVENLSYQDCRRLFPAIRASSTATGRAIVRQHLRGGRNYLSSGWTKVTN